MDTKRLKTRLLREANSAIRQVEHIAKEFTPNTMELSEVRAAARQAEQAAAELNKLAGVLELEFLNK